MIPASAFRTLVDVSSSRLYEEMLAEKAQLADYLSIMLSNAIDDASNELAIDKGVAFLALAHRLAKVAEQMILDTKGTLPRTVGRYILSEREHTELVIAVVKNAAFKIVNHFTDSLVVQLRQFEPTEN